MTLFGFFLELLAVVEEVLELFLEQHLVCVIYVRILCVLASIFRCFVDDVFYGFSDTGLMLIGFLLA